MRIAPSPQPVVTRPSDTLSTPSAAGSTATLPMTREALQVEQVKTKTQDRLNHLSNSLKNDAWGGPPSMFQNMSDKIVNDGAREIQQIRNGGAALHPALERLELTRSPNSPQSFERLPEFPQDLALPEATLPMTREALQVEQVKTKTQDRLNHLSESLKNDAWGGPPSMFQNMSDKIVNDGAREIQQIRSGGTSDLSGQF
ncbi:hypothetical protein [Stigmatella erecta]|uniref:Uncharacterized protein n=1 Tax=Stigmatella erecta TaxID=83460 RepID=A0A1I0JSV5_9BACT|nr:hypothetical protein [Stigmatella erecta]SEU13812.1 hypothetical protein SAMN05443639_10873 [Stigmatella erecta]